MTPDNNDDDDDDATAKLHKLSCVQREAVEMKGPGSKEAQKLEQDGSRKRWEPLRKK